MLHQVRNRIPAGLTSSIDGFVAFASPEVVVLIHSVALIGASLLAGLMVAGIGVTGQLTMKRMGVGR